MAKTFDPAAITQPCSGYTIDTFGLAHLAHSRGPVCVETWCGRSIPGPLVDDVTVLTKRCRACQQAQAAAARAEREAERGHETQGRLL